MYKIKITGARTHNLKNINVELPRDKLIVITGLSGSGKSSLAFDTIYAEGQRRYVESLSSYARQFLSVMEKPDLDNIEGLSPAISIEQKSALHNPRSTVGTVTEIYDYLRLLYARVGVPKCPNHNVALSAFSISQMVDRTLEISDTERVMLLAPIVTDKKGGHEDVLKDLQQQGFIRVRVDGNIIELDNIQPLKPTHKHTIEVVVDRFKISNTQEFKQRLAESFETALGQNNGMAIILRENNESIIFSSTFACPHCGWTINALEPKLFSFNNPYGACADCNGLGTKQYFNPELIIDKHIHISSGAITGWDQRNIYAYSILETVAQRFKIDLNKKFSELSKEQQQVILFGSNNIKLTFKYLNEQGKLSEYTHPFEGIIPNLERRYSNTSSNSQKEILSKFLSTQECLTCSGTRLNTQARNVFIQNVSITDIVSKTILECYNYFQYLQLSGASKQIAEKIFMEITSRLSFLINVGLEYLTLNRASCTLSGGEAQRIRLASQIGAGLVGVMYVLDEPSIGLHQRDNDKLIKTLLDLRDTGNTVIVVEHDEDAILSADYVLDMGPGAGVHGGEIVAQGTPQEIILHKDSITGKYLSGREKIEIPKNRTKINKEQMLTIKGASSNNLRNIDVSFPIGLMTCVTGVSGSGKSTLVNATLYPLAATKLNGATTLEVGNFFNIHGLEHLDKCINIDQSPIGRTPRSNPATYTGIFTYIRDAFANTSEAKIRGYGIGRFSFNIKGGRCEHCQGDGLIKVEMHFLADIYVPCDVCQGKRYNRETLEVKLHGKNIYEVLEMTVEDAYEFFANNSAIRRKLQMLMYVGLSYIKLGQNSITLSGGEAQRIKLATELAKKGTGKTLYILDEPTTGLHFADIKRLLQVLHALRDKGNTLVIIEHNLDVIKTADYIIDIGPEGGSGGGNVVATGTPEEIIKHKSSHTARFLKPLLITK